jgi:hypothetical protein
MELVPAGNAAMVGNYLGYLGPYATSHEDLDADTGLMGEVRNAARSLRRMVQKLRAGYRPPDDDLHEPRPK